MIRKKNLCNLCGKLLDELDEQEGFGFDYHVGFGSKYDLCHLEAHFCIDCFDKLIDKLIPQCNISPLQGEYKLRGEVDLCEAEELAEDFDNT